MNIGTVLDRYGLPTAILGVVLFALYRMVWPAFLAFIKRGEKKQDEAERRIVELTNAAHELNREQTKVLAKYSDNAGEVARQLSAVADKLGILVERSNKSTKRGTR